MVPRPPSLRRVPGLGERAYHPAFTHPAQDEMEIGYIQAPHQTLPVVFDSPRNRGLREFPIKCMLVGAGGGTGGKPLASGSPSSLPVSWPPTFPRPSVPAPAGAVRPPAAISQAGRAVWARTWPSFSQSPFQPGSPCLQHAPPKT